MILTEFSVREQRWTKFAGWRPIWSVSTHGGRHCGSPDHRNSGLPQHSRSLGQTAASCHKVVNDNDDRTWADAPLKSERIG